MLFERYKFYLQSLVAESKKYFKIAWVLALVSMATGIVVFLLEPAVLDYILSIFEDKFGTDRAMDWSMAMDIFKNNLISCAIALFGGILFGLAPLLVVIFNFFAIGILTGFFYTALPANLAIKTVLLLSALLPHGIFELPVILVSCALGFRLGWRWLAAENKGQRGQALKADLILALKAAPLLAVMLFIAAVIEVYGTGNLVEWIMPRIFR